MELSIKHYETTITIKTEHEDLNIEEVFKIINTALIGISWNQSTIDEYIIERAKELKCKK